MPTDKYLKIFLPNAVFAVVAFIAGLIADQRLDFSPIGTAIGVSLAIAAIRNAIKTAYAQGLRDGKDVA